MAIDVEFHYNFGNNDKDFIKDFLRGMPVETAGTFLQECGYMAHHGTLYQAKNHNPKRVQFQICPEHRVIESTIIFG